MAAESGYDTALARFSARRFRARVAATAISLLLAWPAVASDIPSPPQEVFGPLYRVVQLAGLFPDSKTFPDAIPKIPPPQILGQFRKAQLSDRNDLRQFVLKYFNLPANTAGGGQLAAEGAEKPLVDHIAELWPRLVRNSDHSAEYSSLLPLPEPYVIPGGRFREIYYWDSYFTMLGLVDDGKVKLVESMVDDFASLIRRFGHIPNGTRSYYLSRSQPPFFFKMVALLDEHNPGAAYARYLPELKKEYAFWMDGERNVASGAAFRRVVSVGDGEILNRYWDDRATPRDEAFREDVQLAERSAQSPSKLYRNVRAAAESGWDFSSRWFSDQVSMASIDTANVIPVDLNSLLFGLEGAIAQGCERSGDAACARDFNARASRRKAAVNKYLWNSERQLYLDYDWTTRQQRPGLSAAALYPLFTGMADTAQATGAIKGGALRLLRPGGLVTTENSTGQQWDAPNGWAPLQWIAIVGLRNYGANALASTIACRWVTMVNIHYRRSGKLVEKYDVEQPTRSGGGGEYPLQDGFGWTNGVTRRLIALYPVWAASDDLAKCPEAQKASIPLTEKSL